MNPREKENVGAKKEVDMNKHPRISTRQWSSCFKNPRIVRVSRAFGGKDRHSKVCTIRGLRDRRIRLSVPTAIQLYDLQDRLGLSQPSKVVDWLIDATKQEIEKLPPLPMIPTNFTHQEPFSHQNHEQENVQNLFPLNTQFSAPYNSSNLFHWEPRNLSLSQFGGGYADHHSLSSGSDHLYLSPSAAAMPSPIATYSSMENNIDHLRQINHLHNLQQTSSSLFPTTLHLINSPMKSSSLSVNSKDVFSQEKDKRNY